MFSNQTVTCILIVWSTSTISCHYSFVVLIFPLSGNFEGDKHRVFSIIFLLFVVILMLIHFLVSEFVPHDDSRGVRIFLITSVDIASVCFTHPITLEVSWSKLAHAVGHQVLFLFSFANS
ncbi:uncharacterized protein A4U43_C07F20330 [Asparagus officinalis]|uniref:Uncharacterized protein n=1 Tax=Asparagus officinalis TaxID=4686 RepID=A0A5P1EDF8_ASPOF|nr:uncharacterized protein A4U43_C07F20330 [Asparagus officinalis]